MNEPFFPGHFPDYPVMPGVLVIEALAQLASILAWRTVGRKPGDGALIFFAGIDNARFRRLVLPGDQLTPRSGAAAPGARHRQVWRCARPSAVSSSAEADLMAAMRNPTEAGKER